MKKLPMQVRLVSETLTRYNIEHEVQLTNDPTVEDHNIQLTKSVSIQVLGGNKWCVVVENGEGKDVTFKFLPVRRQLNHLMTDVLLELANA